MQENVHLDADFTVFLFVISFSLYEISLNIHALVCVKYVVLTFHGASLNIKLMHDPHYVNVVVDILKKLDLVGV